MTTEPKPTAAAPVTLYRVRRPDGTVIEHDVASSDFKAMRNALNRDEGLGLLAGANLPPAVNQPHLVAMLMPLAKSRGYTIEPVQYVPREVARRLAEALADSRCYYHGSSVRRRKNDCPVCQSRFEAMALARESGVIE
jgi:hypothetical protein